MLPASRVIAEEEDVAESASYGTDSALAQRVSRDIHPLIRVERNLYYPDNRPYNTYTGNGIVNSGSLTSGNSFALKIDAPPGTYEYVCLFHADSYNQKGTITVSP
jgi:hypothetical protein